MRFPLTTTTVFFLAATSSLALGQVKVVAEYVDMDGNGMVDRSEFVYQANLHLDAIIRMNSDGYLIGDSAAIRADMIAYVRSMFGDFNGDGAVTWEDMMAQMANPGPVSAASPKILQGDVNQDGLVDISDVVLLSESAGDPVPDEAFAFALWARIIVEAGDAGYQLSLAEMISGNSALRGEGHRGPNDHNQVITGTWPPTPGTYPPQEWNWPSDHLGTVSSTWNPADWDGTGYVPPAPDYPANHHSAISSTWNDRNEEYWPPNHDIARSSTWNDDGLHQSMTSATWPPAHLRERSIAGLETDVHVAIISWLNEGHNEDTSEAAGWPANHLQHLSRTWNMDHDEATSSAWPSNHMMLISNSWSNPNPGWPANHYQITSLRDSQPGDHDWRISLATHPSNPFRLPPEVFGSQSLSDPISMLELN